GIELAFFDTIVDVLERLLEGDRLAWRSGPCQFIEQKNASRKQMRLDCAKRRDGRLIGSHVEEREGDNRFGMINEVFGGRFLDVSADKLVIAPDVAECVVPFMNLEQLGQIGLVIQAGLVAVMGLGRLLLHPGGWWITGKGVEADDRALLVE